VLRCLGAVYSITTFIIAITSLLQIRQVAQHRSATCSLQGLSSTQRSARATPSRDLTLRVEEQDRRLVRPMPIPTVSHHQGRAPVKPGLGTKVAVLPPMGEGHQPREELEKTKEAEVAKVHQAMKTLIMAEGQGEGGTQAVPRVVPAGMKPHRSPSAANSSDRAPLQAPGPKEGGKSRN
jgi:hypothetical protein